MMNQLEKFVNLIDRLPEIKCQLDLRGWTFLQLVIHNQKGYAAIGADHDLSSERVRQLVEKTWDQLLVVCKTASKKMTKSTDIVRQLRNENEKLKFKIALLTQNIAAEEIDKVIVAMPGDILHCPLSELNLPVRIKNLSTSYPKLKTLNDLLQIPSDHFRKFRNIGFTTIVELRDALLQCGIPYDISKADYKSKPPSSRKKTK